MNDVLLNSIRPTANPLRQVNERSVEFDELRDSIEECGILQPLLVRPIGNDTYEVVDGMHRFIVAGLLQLTSVPCIIKELTDEQVMVAQVECNAHRLETTPLDYARRIRAILKRHPQMTQSDLGRLLHKSSAWVRDTLGLLKLTPAVAKCVERGEVPLKSAYLLAQLGPIMQAEYLKAAMFHTAVEFDALIRPAILNANGGSNDQLKPFDPVPHLRSLKHLKHELATRESAAVVLAAEGVDNILDAFAAALRWVTHTDILSIRKYEHEYRTRHSAHQLLTTPVDVDGE